MHVTSMFGVDAPDTAGGRYGGRRIYNFLSSEFTPLLGAAGTVEKPAD